VKVRFLGYSGPKVCKILYLPTKKMKKPEEERPAPERSRTHWQLVAFESYSI